MVEWSIGIVWMEIIWFKMCMNLYMFGLYEVWMDMIFVGFMLNFVMLKFGWNECNWNWFKYEIVMGIMVESWFEIWMWCDKIKIIMGFEMVYCKENYDGWFKIRLKIETNSNCFCMTFLYEIDLWNVTWLEVEWIKNEHGPKMV